MSAANPASPRAQTAVLVTGGAGYIGSHTCKALARAGYMPVTYDSLEHGHRWAVRWGPLVEGDLADSDLLRRTLAEYGISTVVHFAWRWHAERHAIVIREGHAAGGQLPTAPVSYRTQERSK